jgi:hypothetical protein
MSTETSKKEIIDWISTLEDESVLLTLEGIKRNATFNFDEEVKKGIPLEEAREQSLKKIREMWKKSS